MPTPAPRSSGLRRALWITLAALPTLVAAVLLCWVLIAFLAVRDHLGSWRMTVHDGHGAVIGHGQVDLVVKRWHADWDASPPFVRFSTDLVDEAGTLTLDATGASLVTGIPDPGGGTCQLINPDQDADGLTCWLEGDFHSRSTRQGDCRSGPVLFGFIHGDAPGVVTFSYRIGTFTNECTATATLTR
jgi:hypothetical protein